MGFFDNINAVVNGSAPSAATPAPTTTAQDTTMATTDKTKAYDPATQDQALRDLFANSNNPSTNPYGTTFSDLGNGFFQVASPAAEGVSSGGNFYVNTRADLGSQANPFLASQAGQTYNGARYRGPSDIYKGGQRYGKNEATGQYEPVYEAYQWIQDGSGNYVPQQVFYLESQLPQGASGAKLSEYDPSSNGTLFDQAVQVGVPIGLGIISGGIAAPLAAGGGALASGAAAGAAGGATGTLAATGDLKKAAAAGAMGALSGGAAAGATPALSNLTGLSPGMLSPAVNFGTNYALNGGNARQAAMSAAIGAGAHAIAPTVNAWLNPNDAQTGFDFTDEELAGALDAGNTPQSMTDALLGTPRASQIPGAGGDFFATGAPNDFFTQTGSAVPPFADGTPTGMLSRALASSAGVAPTASPVQVADAEGVVGPASDILGSGDYSTVYQQPAASGLNLNGEPVQNSSTVPQQSTGNAMLDQMMGIQNGSLVDYTDPALQSFMNGTGPKPQQLTPEQQQQQAQEKKVEQNIERFAKVGAQLAKMFNGQGTPQGAPQRAKGQSDADYSQSLVQYAAQTDPALAQALDPAATEALGLVPGTPEYYQYVMNQMDSILDQALQGVDVNSKDLEAQLRGKSREEIDALQRALFVRGQLGQLMGSGNYVDPFTSQVQSVNTLGRRVNPSVAAYHRGLARSAQEIAGMSPVDALRFAGGMLNRNPDLYGMQERANDRRMQEELAAQGYGGRKRRGMFGATPFFEPTMPDDPLAWLNAQGY